MHGCVRMSVSASLCEINGVRIMQCFSFVFMLFLPKYLNKVGLVGNNIGRHQGACICKFLNVWALECSAFEFYLFILCVHNLCFYGGYLFYLFYGHYIQCHCKPLCWNLSLNKDLLAYISCNLCSLSILSYLPYYLMTVWLCWLLLYVCVCFMWYF